MKRDSDSAAKRAGVSGFQIPKHLAFRIHPSLAPFIALLALVVFDVLFVPNFASIQVKQGRLFGAPIDVLHRAAPVMLLAIGMTLVIGTRGIDLSVGAVMAVTAAICASLATRGALPAYAVILVGLAASTAAGLWNGMLVAYIRIQPIVATLILMVAGRGLAQLITAGQIVTFDNRTLNFIAGGSILGLPFTVYIVAAVFLLTLFLARKTVLGTFIEAVGGNETAAAYSGINTALVKLFAYAFCGFCAGAAGLIAMSDIKAADANNIGLNLELDAILSVVIGGTLFTGGRFNLLGSVIGAIFIQALTTTILMKGIPVEKTLVVKALVVILACAVQSSAFQAFVVRAFRRGRVTA